MGTDISLLMSSSVTQHFVMHPANAMRIQHVSSSPRHNFSDSCDNPSIAAEMKAMDCPANNGFEKTSGSQELSGAYKVTESFGVCIHLSLSPPFSLYQVDRVYEEKW